MDYVRRKDITQKFLTDLLTKNRKKRLENKISKQ